MAEPHLGTKGTARPQLSVVIAALNEAEALPLLLADLAAQRGVRLEVMVADGGSTDATPAIAQAAGAELLQCGRGRGLQLNAGAAAATASMLLFLHADTRIPHSNQLALSLQALKQAQAQRASLVAGHWSLRFARTEAGHDYFFRYLEGKTASNRPGTVNGDQGLLIAAQHFQELGGFETALPFFEDQRLAAKIFRQGRFIQLPGQLQTAARRFEAEGHGARYALMALIVGMEAAQLTDLMAGLPALYRAQAHAEALDLAPILDHIQQHIAALPKPRQRAVWQAVGSLLLDNTWQLCHALDSLKPQSQGWLTRQFARLIEPRIYNRACLGIATAVGEGVLSLCFAAARQRLRQRAT